MASTSPKPYWPQLMRRKTAADYCDMSEAAFVREVVSGRLPSATVFGNQERWYRPSIDAALEAIAGGGPRSYETDFWNQAA